MEKDIPRSVAELLLPFSFGNLANTPICSCCQAISLWAKACQGLHTSLNLIFAVHPGHNGSLERSIFKQFGVLDYISFLPTDISLADGAVACNQLTSQGSTANVQSLYISVPSIYLSGPSYVYRNVATAEGLIPETHTVSSYNLAVQQQAAEGFYFDPERLRQRGIPTDPIKKVLQTISTPISSRRQIE